VAMRMSSLFLRTLRENPADAEVPSHQLLVRAGYIRRVSPGIYTWLPLGLKVLKRVEQIVREEMDAIGAQELLFPALLPREPYEATGRWTEYGDNIFRLKDRKDGDYLLGPTHEEMFTLAVKDLFSSYKDLPVTLYQIQTKYRDEARPRAGILRGREFVMKDSYSFDIDDSGLDKSYQLHRDAYIRLFDRLGFHYVIVQAMAGAMGGSKSEEFLATADNGEDTYVRCANCAYAANVEAVKVTAPQELSLDGLPPNVGMRTLPTRRRLPPWSSGSTSDSPAVPRMAGSGAPPTPSRPSSSCSSTRMAPGNLWPWVSPVTARSTRSGSPPR
jgi:prolyl-tRNA synthetase